MKLSLTFARFLILLFSRLLASMVAAGGNYAGLTQITNPLCILLPFLRSIPILAPLGAELPATPTERAVKSHVARLLLRIMCHLRLPLHLTCVELTDDSANS